MPMNNSLGSSFRGEIRELAVDRSDKVPAADDLNLCRMAAAALNYLRGNPDPARVGDIQTAPVQPGSPTSGGPCCFLRGGSTP